MKKGKEFSFKGQFKEALRYLAESRNYICFITALFFVSSVFGFVLRDELGFFDEVLREIITKTEGMNGAELTLYILQNNVLSALYGMLGGIFFGAFPIINAITNGTVLGYVSARVTEAVGLHELWRLLPHGIFELPAIFIALGMGVKLGFAFFARKKGEFKRRLFSGINAFLFVVLPLLVIAALIEGALIAFSGA